MIDEERPDREQDPPAADEAAGDEERGDGAAEQPEDTGVEEPAAEEAEVEEPPAGEAEEPEAEGPPEAEADEPVRPETAEKPKREEPPGAELEPIAIEIERELGAEERARLEAEAEERARREAEATAEAVEEPVPSRKPTAEIPAGATIQATGKRKSSIARVVLRAGSGKIEVNRRNLEEYFPRGWHQTLVRQPLVTSGYQDAVDVVVRVQGGGISGQAGAVRHGIARGLCEVDAGLRGELKRRGLLTRDARRKERRKAGLKKARKRPQFSKR